MSNYSCEVCKTVLLNPTLEQELLSLCAAHEHYRGWNVPTATLCPNCKESKLWKFRQGLEVFFQCSQCKHTNIMFAFIRPCYK